MNLKPLDDRIVVKPNEAEKTTASGLVIPDTAKEKPQMAKVAGLGVIENPGVSVGDIVIYKKYSGSDTLIHPQILHQDYPLVHQQKDIWDS